jgi:hypothetical protein
LVYERKKFNPSYLGIKPLSKLKKIGSSLKNTAASQTLLPGFTFFINRHFHRNPIPLNKNKLKILTSYADTNSDFSD